MSEHQPFRTMYPGYYQTAYVTNDLDRAIKDVGNGYQIKDWYTNSEFTFGTREGRSVTIKVGLAYIGDTQIEIIEPVGGDDGLYRNWLSGNEYQAKFHHICKAFDTEEQYFKNLDWLKRSDVELPILISAEEGGYAHACYADFRSSLGHYLEYVWFTEAGSAWMSEVPRN